MANFYGSYVGYGSGGGKGTELYQKLPEQCKAKMKECTPLHTIKENSNDKQKITFETWKKQN